MSADFFQVQLLKKYLTTLIYRFWLFIFMLAKYPLQINLYKAEKFNLR
jgi:hypothetical protein